jgi:ribosomal protein L37AE/L43A
MTDKTNETALTQAAPTALAKQDYGIDVGRVVAMRAAVEEVIKKVLREGEHYGALPGVQGKDGKPPKKMLFQPGAEVLCQVFRLRPEYQELSVVERDDFISLKLKCRLFNSVTGEQVGEAIGSANSREDKYASQVAAKLCPTCGAPTIFKSKDGGWFCWAKKGGCGATFAEEDKKMLDQTGTVSIVRLYGLYHTLESIAQKRCFVKATRTATATSDIFTDEDAPAEDEEPGQAGSKSHARTQPSQPAGATKAGVTDVQKLTAALTAAQIGTHVDPELSPEQFKEQSKKAKLAWVNGILEDCGQLKVSSALELTPEQIKDLIGKAESGQMPQGW